MCFDLCSRVNDARVKIRFEFWWLNKDHASFFVSFNGGKRKNALFMLHAAGKFGFLEEDSEKLMMENTKKVFF